MKFTKCENYHKLLSDEAYSLFIDSDLTIGESGSGYALFTAGGMSDYNLIRDGLTEKELDALICEICGEDS